MTLRLEAGRRMNSGRGALARRHAALREDPDRARPDHLRRGDLWLLRHIVRCTRASARRAG
eukprot:7451869-Alexandrium_andersonii.AAC.1